MVLNLFWDVLSIIEKAEEAFDEEEALKLEQKLRKQEFDLDLTCFSCLYHFSFFSSFSVSFQMNS